MDVKYEFIYSGTPDGSSTPVEGLLITDTSTSKTYILQIPVEGLTISEGQAGPFDIVEVDPESLEMVHASSLFQSKSVTPAATEQVVQPDNDYIGLTQVSVAAAPLETKSVKSNTVEEQTVTPGSGKIGFSEITVQKYDGEGGTPETVYTNGDVVYFKLPSKFENLVDKVAEFKGYYKGIVVDDEASYMRVKIEFADESVGPMLPMFDLIGKVTILTEEDYAKL